MQFLPVAKSICHSGQYWMTDDSNLGNRGHHLAGMVVKSQFYNYILSHSINIFMIQCDYSTKVYTVER